MVKPTIVQGRTVSIDAMDGVMVDGANVEQEAYIEASNGVIHVIDAVILLS